MYCIDICIMYKCIIYAITHLSPTYPILCKCSRASRKEDMDKTNKIYFDKMDNSMENFFIWYDDGKVHPHQRDFYSIWRCNVILTEMIYNNLCQQAFIIIIIIIRCINTSSDKMKISEKFLWWSIFVHFLISNN